MLCREYILDVCPNKLKCKFEHPDIITPEMRQKCLRDINRCYCGCSLKTIMNRYNHSNIEDENIFFSVCSRTNKSIENCRRDLNNINQ